MPNLIKAIANHLAYRRAYREISGLDARQRADIGIEGCDIHDVLRSAARMDRAASGASLASIDRRD